MLTLLLRLLLLLLLTMKLLTMVIASGDRNHLYDNSATRHSMTVYSPIITIIITTYRGADRDGQNDKTGQLCVAYTSTQLFLLYSVNYEQAYIHPVTIPFCI